MLNLGIATKLLADLGQWISYPVLLIDRDGVIVSGTNTTNRGTVHTIGIRIMTTSEETIIVREDKNGKIDEDEAGVYTALIVNNEKVGVLAVLGVEKGCESQAGILKACIEKTLENELLKHSVSTNNEQQIHRLIYNSNLSKEDLEYLSRISGIQPDIVRIPILIIAHDSDVPKRRIDANLIKNAIINSEMYSSTDLISRTLDDFLIWFKTINKEDILRMLTNHQDLDDELMEIKDKLNIRYYSVYIGPMLDDLRNYCYGYRQCEWMRLYICKTGIYYFHNYLLGYIGSKVKQREFQSAFSAVYSQLTPSAVQNFCEVMEVLIQNDYNIAKAAEQLFVHKNTIIYRYDKIRSLFGMNFLTNNKERTYLEIFYNYCLKQTESIADNA